jgi:hypothetical protein
MITEQEDCSTNSKDKSTNHQAAAEKKLKIFKSSFEVDC